MKLDQEAMKQALASLPLYARWMIDSTPLDFDFSIAKLGLRELPDDIVKIGDAARANLLIFGEYDFAESGGANPWLCVHKQNGFVYGLDVEREDAIFLLNSSVERFIKTFLFLNKYLGNLQGSPLPTDCENQLRNIDPDAFLVSEWRLLVDSLGSI